MIWRGPRWSPRSRAIANHLTLDLVGPVSLPEREIVERAARMLGREVKIGSIPKQLLSFVLAIGQRIGKPGFSRDALEVITADTRLNPQPAASVHSESNSRESTK